MHNSYNQFLFHSFLSALHVSNESSRSSYQEHGIIYCITQFGTISTIVQASPACTIVLIVVCNTAFYAVLLMMND